MGRGSVCFLFDTILGFLSLVTGFLATKLWLPCQDCDSLLVPTSCYYFFFFSTCLPNPIFSVAHSFELFSALHSNWLGGFLTQEEDFSDCRHTMKQSKSETVQKVELKEQRWIWGYNVWINILIPSVHTNGFLQCCLINEPKLLFGELKQQNHQWFYLLKKNLFSHLFSTSCLCKLYCN